MITPMQLVEKLVLLGIEVTLKRNGDTLLADLNTGAKSHCILDLALSTEQQMIFHLRYDRTISVGIPQWYTSEEIINEVLDIVLYDCTHGRDFIGESWLSLAKEYEKVIPEELM